MEYKQDKQHQGDIQNADVWEINGYRLMLSVWQRDGKCSDLL